MGHLQSWGGGGRRHQHRPPLLEEFHQLSSILPEFCSELVSVPGTPVMSLHHLKGPHSYYQVKPWLKAEARQPAVTGTEMLWVAVALMKSITVLHVLLSDPEVPTSQAWPRWSDQEAEWLDTKAPRIVTELLPERGAPSQASPMWLPKFVHSLHNCTGQPTGKPQSRQICLHLTHRLCPKSCSAAVSAQQPWEQFQGLAPPLS